MSPACSGRVLLFKASFEFADIWYLDGQSIALPVDLKSLACLARFTLRCHGSEILARLQVQHCIFFQFVCSTHRSSFTSFRSFLNSPLIPLPFRLDKSSKNPQSCRQRKRQNLQSEKTWRRSEKGPSSLQMMVNSASIVLPGYYAGICTSAVMVKSLTHDQPARLMLLMPL